MTAIQYVDSATGSHKDVSDVDPLPLRLAASPTLSRLAAMPVRHGGILVPATSFQLTAAEQSISVKVEAGAELSLAAAVPNFISGGTFALAFEKSKNDGTDWEPLTVTPKTLIANRAPVSITSAVGLWRYDVEDGVTDVRIRCTSLVTLTEVRAWIELFEAGRKIHLPYLGLTSGTYGQATNLPCVPPIEWDRLGDAILDFQTVTGTSQTLVWQETNDDAGVNWGGTSGVNATTNTGNSAIVSMTTAGRIRVTPTAQYFRVNLTYSALTALTINGITASVISSIAVPAQINAIIQGGAADGQTKNGNSMAIAGEAVTSAPSAITAGRVYTPILDSFRRQVIASHLRELIDTNVLTLTTTTETQFIAAVASVTHDIKNLVLSNSGTNAQYALIRPALASGTIYPFWMPAGSCLPMPWDVLKQLAQNAAWTLQLSAVPTSGDVRLVSISHRTR